jgi:hypothetical protein
MPEVRQAPQAGAGMLMSRWPVIRHLRWLILAHRVNRHYAMWSDLGYLPVHAQHDIDVLNAIWRGER